jgi:anhydro-N-acetylmuramic acid kinase
MLGSTPKSPAWALTSPPLFIGLMSGTSLDGVDGVLADFSGAQPRVLAHHAMPLAPALKQELLALNTPSENELGVLCTTGPRARRVCKGSGAVPLGNL